VADEWLINPDLEVGTGFGVCPEGRRQQRGQGQVSVGRPLVPAAGHAMLSGEVCIFSIEVFAGYPMRVFPEME